MVQRFAVGGIFCLGQQVIHGPPSAVVGRSGGGQVIMVAQQAVADEVSTETDVGLGVVEIVKGQILAGGDLQLDPVEGLLGDLHQAAGAHIGLSVWIKVALGTDEGV